MVDLLGEATSREYLCGVRFEGKETTPRPMAVVRAQEFIAHHFVRLLSVVDVARVACCSVNHLTQLFHGHLRTTLARFL